MNPVRLTVGGNCTNTCTVDCGHCKGVHATCAACEETVVGAGVRDDTEVAWRGRHARRWCNTACREATDDAEQNADAS